MPTFIYFTPEKDAYISEYYANSNFGDVPYLYTNNYKSAVDEYQSLVKFDLCSLSCNQVPPNSDLDPNQLFLHIYRNEIPSCTRLYAYRVVSYWDELKVTWNTKPLVDYNSPVGYVDIPSGYFGQVTMDLDPFVIQSWYNGYYKNNGLLLKCDEPCNSLIGFYSREFINPDLWPKLWVCYDLNCCVGPPI
ncbi:MAG: DNRLRE domain-containing protein [Syntrophomonadaceae bacterium]|nr:DNRLRE domain-containing protein [Syntrophomonadaceae bacterium]